MKTLRATVAVTAAALVALTGCGSEGPSQSDTGHPAPLASAVEPGRIIGTLTLSLADVAAQRTGSQAAIEPAEAQVDCRPDQVVVRVSIAPVAAARPVITISKNRNVSVTDSRGNAATNLTNNGGWSYPTVQLQATSTAVVWKTESGREYTGIELSGAVQCGQAPPPASSTGY